jgi:hypothetical protein
VCGIWLSLLWCASLEADTPSATDSLSLGEESGAVWVDPEEAATVLAELRDNGIVLTEDDWRRLGLEPELSTSDPRNDRRPLSTPAAESWRCRALWRINGRPQEFPSHSARIWLDRGSLHVSLKHRRDGSAQRATGMALAWRASRNQVLFGGVGAAYGLGLFVAGPGRWSSLSSSASLYPGRAGPISYVGSRDPQALWGAASRLDINSWRLDILWGKQQSLRADQKSGRVGVMGLTKRWSCFEVGGWLGQQGDATGGSATFSAVYPLGLMVFETASWRFGAENDWQSAWAVLLRLARDSWLIEGQMAGSQGGTGAPLAQRPAILPGWQGRGWAIRGSLALPSRLRLRILAAQGLQRRLASDNLETLQTETWEAALEQRFGPGWRGEVRYRTGVIETLGWEDRSPWLPPADRRLRGRDQIVALLQHQRRHLGFQISLRALKELRDDLEASLATGRRRCLVATRSDWLCGARWRLRFAWGWAWGETVDLVSVASPLTGYVIPRHWGRWKSESSIACEYRHTWGWIQLGAAWRTPDDMQRGPTETEFLARSRLSW